MDAAMEAALDADAPLVFWAVSFIGTDIEILLTEGPTAGIDFGPGVFSGEHPDYGVVVMPEEFGDGVSGEAPSFSLTFLPPSEAAAGALFDSVGLDCQVALYFGVLDRDTGQPIGEPDPRLLGEVDVPTLHYGQGSCAVEMECTSVFERLFEVDEGIGLNDASHQSYMPGEKGMAFAHLDVRLPWGANAPRAGVVAGPPPTAKGIMGAVQRTAYEARGWV